jgi:hypothetical protein
MSSGQYCDDCAGHYFNCSCKSKNIKAGAEIMAGDGGYSESTREKYEAAVEARIKSIETNINLMKKEKMNERIREVWIKAAREDSGPDNWDTQEQFIEKFAELIVQECATSIANDTTNYQGEGMMAYYQGVQDAVKVIRKHFGVE